VCCNRDSVVEKNLGKKGGEGVNFKKILVTTSPSITPDLPGAPRSGTFDWSMDFDFDRRETIRFFISFLNFLLTETRDFDVQEDNQEEWDWQEEGQDAYDGG